MRPSRFVLPRVETTRQALKLWSMDEVRRLRELAESGVELREIASSLRRSVAAVRNKAAMHGISLIRARQIP